MKRNGVRDAWIRKIAETFQWPISVFDGWSLDMYAIDILYHARYWFGRRKAEHITVYLLNIAGTFHVLVSFIIRSELSSFHSFLLSQSYDISNDIIYLNLLTRSWSSQLESPNYHKKAPACQESFLQSIFCPVSASTLTLWYISPCDDQCHVPCIYIYINYMILY